MFIYLRCMFLFLALVLLIVRLLSFSEHLFNILTCFLFVLLLFRIPPCAMIPCPCVMPFQSFLSRVGINQANVNMPKPKNETRNELLSFLPSTAAKDNENDYFLLLLLVVGVEIDWIVCRTPMLTVKSARCSWKACVAATFAACVSSAIKQHGVKLLDCCSPWQRVVCTPGPGTVDDRCGQRLRLLRC